MKRKDLLSELVTVIQNNPPKSPIPTATVVASDGAIVTLGNKDQRGKAFTNEDFTEETEE